MYDAIGLTRYVAVGNRFGVTCLLYFPIQVKNKEKFTKRKSFVCKGVPRHL